jgi:hypothetical protein
MASVHLENQNLSNLPNLSSNLVYLFCSNNQLTTLPSSLPNSLQYLNCRYNKLTLLPPLPVNLTQLYCDNNRLTSIPELPNNLVSLDCANNELTELPKLPNNLQYLKCANNPLVVLPELSDSLENMIVSFDQSHLIRLLIQNEKFTRLVRNSQGIPLGIIVVDIDGENITDVTKYNKEWREIIALLGNDRTVVYMDAPKAEKRLKENIATQLTINPPQGMEPRTGLPREARARNDDVSKVFRILGKEISIFMAVILVIILIASIYKRRL